MCVSVCVCVYMYVYMCTRARTRARTVCMSPHHPHAARPVTALPLRHALFKFEAKLYAMQRPRVLEAGVVRGHTPSGALAGRPVAGVAPPRAALAALSANSPRLAVRGAGAPTAKPAPPAGDFDQLFCGLASDLEELASGASGAGECAPPPSRRGRACAQPRD